MDKKPPLGLVPKQIHKEQRIKDILDAIGRYTIEEKPISLAWIEELNELMENPIDLKHEELIMKIEVLQEYVGLLAEKGLRCDLNPTHDLENCENFWHRYIMGVEERIKGEALETLGHGGM